MLADSALFKAESLSKEQAADAFNEQQKIEAAKGFESLLVSKLVDTMQQTVGQWGLEKDSAYGQIQGIFNHFLTDAVSEQGGLGLWKQLCSQFEQTTEPIEQNNFDGKA